MRTVANKLSPLGLVALVGAVVVLLVGLVYAVNSTNSQTGWRSAAPDSFSQTFIVAQTPLKIAALRVVNATPLAKPAVHLTVKPKTYQVRAGYTLSSIAARVYGSSKYWTVLYWFNHIKNPNLITIGQTLKVPPRPLRIPAAPHIPAPAPVQAPVLVVAHAVTSSQAPSQSSPAPTGNSGGLSGFLSYSGLEQLWVAAGGNPAYEATAACIAEHESGGNQYALSPTNDYGYWQINGSNGALATYDAYGNARAAIQLSNDGTDWHLWTTHIYCGV